MKKMTYGLPQDSRPFQKHFSKNKSRIKESMILLPYHRECANWYTPDMTRRTGEYHYYLELRYVKHWPMLLKSLFQLQ